MIEIKNLSKSFGDKNIFEKFNYKISDGSMLAIVGKSGSGKSTLLNILGLLDHNYDGEVIYDGENIINKKEKDILLYVRKNISYLFQNYALVDEETVEYNLLLALEYERISKNEKLKRITEVLRSVDLEKTNIKKVYELSGGEQQRLALARIMLRDAKIILADEPTGNLDYYNSVKVMELLKEMNNNGKTIIIVTHNDKIAEQCDEIIKL